jgi:hypothetical protein
LAASTLRDLKSGFPQCGRKANTSVAKPVNSLEANLQVDCIYRPSKAELACPKSGDLITPTSLLKLVFLHAVDEDVPLLRAAEVAAHEEAATKRVDEP